MQSDPPTPPKYNLALVEAVMLEVAAELHPQRLAADELSRRIVSDTRDTREVEIALQAIRNLGQSGLFHRRDDEIVEPTQAAIRAVALLT